MTCKKELEAAKQGLDAVRKVLDFSDVEESVFAEYESHHESQDHPDLTERYVMENVKIDIPPPDPVVNEYIPSAAMANTHNNPESEPQRNSLNPVVPPVVKQNNTFDLAKAFTKNQMVPQRLWKFDGEPGRYITWKHSCLNVMNDINSTTFEQLDLLLNNLGQVCIKCSVKIYERSKSGKSPISNMGETGPGVWKPRNC